jgi:hypothetical protein
MNDCQRVASRVESCTNWGVTICVVQSYLSACGVQVCTIDMVVNGKGEGHAVLCRWTRSGKGRALGLDQGTVEAG